MELAEKHNLKFIGCNYGFGKTDELLNANYIINNFNEILDIGI